MDPMSPSVGSEDNEGSQELKNSCSVTPNALHTSECHSEEQFMVKTCIGNIISKKHLPGFKYIFITGDSSDDCTHSAEKRTEMSDRCAKSERGLYCTLSCFQVPSAQAGQICQKCHFKFITVHVSGARFTNVQELFLT
jgi:hypothetical protein